MRNFLIILLLTFPAFGSVNFNFYLDNDSTGSGVPPFTVTVYDNITAVGETITSKRYYWGDGTSNLSTETQTHTYLERGVFTISVKVETDLGNKYLQSFLGMVNTNVFLVTPTEISKEITGMEVLRDPIGARDVLVFSVGGSFSLVDQDPGFIGSSPPSPTFLSVEEITDIADAVISPLMKC